MNQACPFCNNEKEFTKGLVKEYSYWRIELHTSQYYLGRSVVILERHAEDIFDITEEEAEELFSITRRLRDGIKKTFKADMLNYATLGNIVRHVHLHVIPRYQAPVSFAGITFKDERWGQNYAPYDKTFAIPSPVYGEIKAALLKNL